MKETYISTGDMIDKQNLTVYMDNWQDEVILLELKCGPDKVKAFEQLFAKYYKYFCRRAYEIIWDEHLCEDIVQAMFAEFYEHRLYDTIEISIRACLEIQCRNRCLNYLKAKSRNEEKLKNYRDFSNSIESPNFETTFQIRERLGNEVGAMPPQQQRAFVLVYNEEKGYAEAAHEMGISINSLKTHLKLAIKRLRIGLADLI